MRCTSNRTNSKYTKVNFIMSMLLIIAMMISMTGCGRLSYTMPYSINSQISGFDVVSGRNPGKVEAFAADLCVVTEDIIDDENVDMTEAIAAVLFDVNQREVIYSKNAHERMHPASLTKVLTALVAIKNSSLDTVLTASSVVNINESGAQLCGLKSGDTMTMDQALRILLMYSANDVAMLIAENVGGTVEEFYNMMNEEAKRLGATNSNFLNPHGLTQEGHYTTAYDLYLIFNEAIKYDIFNEIIHTANYQTTYYDKDGNPKELSFETSNLFLRGNYTPPENITVVGGKTGTTNAARNCLILLSRDMGGAPYISVILSSKERDILYKEMIDLLDEIN